MPIALLKFLETIATKLKCFCFIQCCVTVPENTREIFPRIQGFNTTTDPSANSDEVRYKIRAIQQYNRLRGMYGDVNEVERLLAQHPRPNSCPPQVDMSEGRRPALTNPSHTGILDPFERTWS